MREVAAHRHCGRRIGDAPHLRIPPVCQLNANVQLLRNELLGADAALGSGYLGRIDERVVRALDDRPCPVAGLRKRAADILEVAGQVLDSLRARALGICQVVDAGVETVDERLPYLDHQLPGVALPRLPAKPEGHGVISATALGDTRQAADGVEEVRRGDGKARSAGSRLGKQTQGRHGRLIARGKRRERVYDTRLRAAKLLEGGPHAFRGHLKGPLPARLCLKGMGLVNDPVANRRQDTALGLDVSQQEGMIRHHDVRR